MILMKLLQNNKFYSSFFCNKRNWIYGKNF